MMEVFKRATTATLHIKSTLKITHLLFRNIARLLVFQHRLEVKSKKIVLTLGIFGMQTKEYWLRIEVQAHEIWLNTKLDINDIVHQLVTSIAEESHEA